MAARPIKVMVALTRNEYITLKAAAKNEGIRVESYLRDQAISMAINCDPDAAALYDYIEEFKRAVKKEMK